jgi:Rrf2 family protein
MLKLTKKADYGLIALKHLAVRAATDPLSATASAKEIAETYHIPLPLLAKVLQKLGKAGFLRSEQGTNGGYRLAREAKGISTLDVIMALDGPIILTHCFTTHTNCDQSSKCTVREPLRKVHEGILRLLGGISVWDLAQDDIPEMIAMGVPPPKPAPPKLYELAGLAPASK